MRRRSSSFEEHNSETSSLGSRGPTNETRSPSAIGRPGGSDGAERGIREARGLDRHVHTGRDRCRSPTFMPAAVAYALLEVPCLSAGSATVQVKSAACELAALDAAVTGFGPGKKFPGRTSPAQRGPDPGPCPTRTTANACSTLGAFTSEANAQAGMKANSILAWTPRQLRRAHRGRPGLLTALATTSEYSSPGPPRRAPRTVSPVRAARATTAFCLSTSGPGTTRTCDQRIMSPEKRTTASRS